MRVKEWIIHKLGGYTSKEVFSRALELAQKMKARDIEAINNLREASK